MRSHLHGDGTETRNLNRLSEGSGNEWALLVPTIYAARISLMIVALALLSLVLGAAAARAAALMPVHVKLLENCSGALLIGGLALLSTALPMMP